MSDLKRSTQTDTGFQTGRTDAGSAQSEPEENRDAEFGTSERATRGTNRDADETGETKNPGHGHAREDRESGQR